LDSRVLLCCITFTFSDNRSPIENRMLYPTRACPTRPLPPPSPAASAPLAFARARGGAGLRHTTKARLLTSGAAWGCGAPPQRPAPRCAVLARRAVASGADVGGGGRASAAVKQDQSRRWVGGQRWARGGGRGRGRGAWAGVGLLVLCVCGARAKRSPSDPPGRTARARRRRRSWT
jgi:hypothetical protein